MYNNADVITETYEDIAAQNCKFFDYNEPAPV